MKVWLVALMFLTPLALSARAYERVTFDRHAVEEDAADEVVPYDNASSAPISIATWLAIIVGWGGLLVLETRMNAHVKHLHGVIDKLERYVNTRDNILALRIDELGAAESDDPADERRKPSSGRADDWLPARRH